VNARMGYGWEIDTRAGCTPRFGDSKNVTRDIECRSLGWWWPMISVIGEIMG
jgi:hypothetical protein